MSRPVFANAPALLVDYLRPALAASPDPLLAGVLVLVTVPPTRSSSAPPLLVIRRSGGPAEYPVRDRPRLDFMAWHETEFKASHLAAAVRSLLLYDLPGQVINGHVCYRPAEFSGPLPYPDPAGSSVPIVMFTVEIPIRVL